MGRAEVLQGVREMRFEGLLERQERGELSQIEAAELLGVSERTFRRGVTGCMRREPRVCVIGGSASRRAGGRWPRRSCGCWGCTRSGTKASR